MLYEYISSLVWPQSLCWELLQLQLEVATPWLVGPSSYSLFSASVRSGLQKRRWAPQATSARWENYPCILYTLRQTATSSWRLGHGLSLGQEALFGTVGAGSSSNLFRFGDNFAELFWRQIILNIVSLSLSWQPGFPYQQEYVYFERTTPVWLINLNYDLFLIFNDTHDQIISPKSHWQALVLLCEFITFLCVFHKYVSEFPHNRIHKIVPNH